MKRIAKFKAIDYVKFFDILAKGSLDLNKLAAINKLKDEIRLLENECGSCQKFMTKQCPWEAKMKRITINPICDEFSLSLSAFHAIESRTQHLKELEQ